MSECDPSSPTLAALTPQLRARVSDVHRFLAAALAAGANRDVQELAAGLQLMLAFRRLVDAMDTPDVAARTASLAIAAQHAESAANQARGRAAELARQQKTDSFDAPPR